MEIPDVAGGIGQFRCTAAARLVPVPFPEKSRYEVAWRKPARLLIVLSRFTGSSFWPTCPSNRAAMAEVNIRQEEHEQMSTSLEVEQLDTNLFRSKSLWLPIRARGVYGGQVISQALVSATNCVSPDYALHVSAPCTHCHYAHSVLVIACRSSIHSVRRLILNMRTRYSATSC